MLGRPIVPPNSKLEIWYNETMQRDELRNLDIVMREAFEEYKESKRKAQAKSN